MRVIVFSAEGPQGYVSAELNENLAGAISVEVEPGSVTNGMQKSYYTATFPDETYFERELKKNLAAAYSQIRELQGEPNPNWREK